MRWRNNRKKNFLLNYDKNYLYHYYRNINWNCVVCDIEIFNCVKGFSLLIYSQNRELYLQNNNINHNINNYNIDTKNIFFNSKILLKFYNW